MLTQQKLILSLALVLFTSSAKADPLVYVIGAAGTTNQGQFGTVDVQTGTFEQIGPATPDGSFGLVPGPNGSLFTLAYSGDLYSISPTTGATTFINQTGLGNCDIVGVSPCGPNSSFYLGILGGKIYATDYQNNLYGVNPSTGAATLIGHTGVPAAPFVLGSLNPDGTINFADEALWGAGGKLYATFDALTFDLNSNSVVSVLVAPALYQIDPLTGITTAIGSTDLGIGAVADVNGTEYAFSDLTDQIESLDLASGNTHVLNGFDPAAGVIQGASPVVPEPASLALTIFGITAISFWRRQRRLRLLRLL